MYSTTKTQPFITLALLVSMHTLGFAVVRDDYDLTVDVATRAIAGWKLYLNEEYAGEFRDGHYTNPEPNKLGHEFWSDGKTAKFDRDHNGHFETIFVIKDETLVYKGSLGSNGAFVHTARAFENDPSLKKSPDESGGDKTAAKGGYLDENEKPDVASQTDKATIQRANKGWEMYLKKDFAGDWRGGHYTNPEPETQLKEFWSDEVIAKFDRDGNGHHESIFFVNKKSEIEYVGKLGGSGKFVEVERRYRKFKNKSIAAFQRVAKNVKAKKI